MSKPIERVEIITGRERHWRCTAEEKVRLVEEAMQLGKKVSAVAWLHGVSPSLLFQSRRRMAEGGHEAVRADQEVVPVSRVRELEAKVRELERLLGRKTMETEILRETVADTLNVARSNLLDQLRRPERPRRGPYHGAEDQAVLAEIRAITDARPTYGYRRVTALLNRGRRSFCELPLNHKRIFRLMRLASLLLQPQRCPCMVEATRTGLTLSKATQAGGQCNKVAAQSMSYVSMSYVYVYGYLNGAASGPTRWRSTPPRPVRRPPASVWWRRAQLTTPPAVAAPRPRPHARPLTLPGHSLG
jgi:transposase